jgi:hypothetical protein
MQEHGIFTIKYDQSKNLFIFPRNCVNIIFEKLEPYCRKKKVNLVSIPEFVFSILESCDYKPKTTSK